MEANTNLEMNRNNHWHYYFDMWLKPRKTMREIIDQPTKAPHVLFLMLLGVFIFLMDKAAMREVGDTLPMSTLFFMITIGTVIVAAFYYYIIGGLYYWIGSWLGGTGKYRDIRLAIAYSYIPIIWSIIIWVPLLILFGRENFTSETPLIDSSFGLLLTYFVLLLIDFVIGIWGVFTFIKCLAEAHKFSAWKALFTVVLLYVGLIIVLVISF